MFATEVILDHVASFLRKEDPEDVKWLNFYKNGQVRSLPLVCCYFSVPFFGHGDFLCFEQCQEITNHPLYYHC